MKRITGFNYNKAEIRETHIPISQSTIPLYDRVNDYERKNPMVLLYSRCGSFCTISLGESNKEFSYFMIMKFNFFS